MSKLIIITGTPASGKTTMLREVVNRFSIPYFYKDEFKEVISESVSDLDLPLSKELGLASFKITFLIIERFAKFNMDLVIEGNFRPKYDEESLKELLKKYDINCMQILCESSFETVKRRLIERKLSGERHQAHFDLGRESEFEEQIKRGYYDFFNVDSLKLKVNTTDFDTVQFEDIYAKIHMFISE